MDPANSTFSCSITNLISILCVLMKFLSHINAKSKTKRTNNFKFRTFNIPFSSNIMAVKGLTLSGDPTESQFFCITTRLNKKWVKYGIE